KFGMIEPRRQDIEYKVEHHGDSFYILHNEKGINFTLVQTPVSQPGRENWKTVIGHRDDTYLTSVEAFKDHLVISTREKGLPALRVRRLADAEEHTITFPEASYAAGMSTNREFKTDVLRLSYTSMITPQSIFDYNVKTRERTLLKEEPV